VPKVSVIIPTYDRARLVGRAIHSVLNQAYRDFELIIVDDGSSDDTQRIVEGFKDDRIRFIRHTSNLGGSAARNTGLDLSRGKYIGFLDDDDEWLPEKLEKQVKAIEGLGNNVGLIYCASLMVSKKTNCVLDRTDPLYRGYLYRVLLRRNIFPIMTALTKRKCFSRVGGFDEELPSCQDWDVWIRISKYYEFAFIPDTLARTFLHGEQISTDLSKKIRGREILVEKYREVLKSYPAILAFHLKRLGILWCLSGNRKKALNYFIKSLGIDASQKACYAYILFSLLAPRLHNKYLRRNYLTAYDEFTLFQ